MSAWPWMALLLYTYEFGFAGFATIKQEYDCGGSLITSRHVLTAAHCVKEGLSDVRLGEWDVRMDNEEAKDVSIAKILTSKDYDPKLLVNDIAILLLGQTVEFNDFIRPICLPVFGDLLNRRFVNSNPFLAGWGTVDVNRQDKMSPILMQAQVPVITNEKCKRNYEKIGFYKDDVQFDDHVLCAGFDAGGQDSCSGDSGGPLMIPIENNGTFPFYQIGIISWGESCAMPNMPGVYTSVQYQAEFIKKTIRIH